MRKDWDSYVGRKFDLLTVAGVIAPAVAQKMLNLSRKQTHFVCVCECGAARYAPAIDVERGYITSCGSKECKNKIKQTKRAATWAKLGISVEKPLLPLLKPEADWPYKEERQVPAIIERLNPKWACKRPVTDCAINQFCHLCCKECDRSCHHDVCNNCPGKCGNSRLRERKR